MWNPNHWTAREFQGFDLKNNFKLKLYIIFGILPKIFLTYKIIFDIQTNFLAYKRVGHRISLNFRTLLALFQTHKKSWNHTVNIQILFMDCEHLTTFVLSLLSGRSVDREVVRQTDIGAFLFCFVFCFYKLRVSGRRHDTSTLCTSVWNWLVTACES